MGKFNSYDHYIYYCGQESLRRNGGAIIVNKSAALGYNLKNSRMILIHFQDKSYNIMVVQVYAPTTVGKKLKLTSSGLTYKIS